MIITSALRRWLARFALAVVPVTLLLGGIELCFRLRPAAPTVTTQVGIVESDPDPRLLWRLAPQAGGPLATNELGLRDDPVLPGASPRVLLLGDSVAWGNGIDDRRQVFPQILERRLADIPGGDAVVVVNASVPGYSTFQELRWLETRGLDLAPDAVVLQVCLNDVTERYWSLSRYGGQTAFLGIDTRRALNGTLGLAVRSSHAAAAFYRSLQVRSRGREAVVVRDLAHDELDPFLTEAWRIMLSELDGIRVAVEEHGLPFLVQVAPFRFQAAAPGLLRQPQDRLLDWAESADVPIVDLLPLIARLGPDLAAEAFNDPSHLSVMGHALAAEQLWWPVAELLGLAPNGGAPEPAALLAAAAAETAANGDLSLAASVLEVARNTDPGLIEIYQYGANIAYLNGDPAGAREQLQKGLEVDPGNQLLRHNLDALDRP